MSSMPFYQNILRSSEKKIPAKQAGSGNDTLTHPDHISRVVLTEIGPLSFMVQEKKIKMVGGLFVALVLFLSGCMNIGPRTIVQDRFDYTTALSDSWKDQMLLNMVKLRYGDAPVFLDVSSVINSYELSGSANLGGEWTIHPVSELIADSRVSGNFATRPTITYNPLSGEKLARSLMSPLPISSIMNLIQSGYSADMVFWGLVQAINGVKNRYGGVMAPVSGGSGFYELVEKMRRIQSSGALGIKVQKLDEKETNIMAVFDHRAVDKNIEADIADVKKILGLDPQENEFKVVYGFHQGNNKEIAILSRSMLQVLGYLASHIEVPKAHMADNRAYAPYKVAPGNDVPFTPPLRVHSSPERPEDAFFSVPYHHYWFWIDDKDLSSKQIFSFLMFIFTLVETGEKEGVPIVTIPVR